MTIVIWSTKKPSRISKLSNWTHFQLFSAETKSVPLALSRKSARTGNNNKNAPAMAAIAMKSPPRGRYFPNSSRITNAAAGSAGIR